MVAWWSLGPNLATVIAGAAVYVPCFVQAVWAPTRDYREVSTGRTAFEVFDRASVALAHCEGTPDCEYAVIAGAYEQKDLASRPPHPKPPSRFSFAERGHKESAATSETPGLPVANYSTNLSRVQPQNALLALINSMQLATPANPPTPSAAPVQPATPIGPPPTPPPSITGSANFQILVLVAIIAAINGAISAIFMWHWYYTPPPLAQQPSQPPIDESSTATDREVEDDDDAMSTTPTEDIGVRLEEIIDRLSAMLESYAQVRIQGPRGLTSTVSTPVSLKNEELHRYISVQPLGFHRSRKRGSQRAVENSSFARLSRWRKGLLGCWETRNAFTQRLEPVISVSLMDIARVTCVCEESVATHPAGSLPPIKNSEVCAVILRGRIQQLGAQPVDSELAFRFSTEQEAKIWASTLLALLEQMKDDVVQIAAHD